jgi:hypothetical protein
VSIPKSGQFGEPWAALELPDGTGEVGIRDGHHVESLAYVRRVVACVNALDGKDPEALARLIEASELACDEHEKEDGTQCADCTGMMALRAALAAFEVRQ